MDNEDMTHADAQPATKGDLRALSARIDERFATKADLERFATKLDFESLRTELREEMAAFRRDAGFAYVQLTGELNSGIAMIVSEFASFRSQLLHMTGDAVSKADFSIRGQTILGHRVDELEKRVSDLETKPTRSS